MYKIYFYKAKDGSQPVADYIRGLASKADKDSRIKLNKIQDYINALSEYGSYQFSTKNSGNDTVKSPIIHKNGVYRRLVEAQAASGGEKL